MGTEVLPPQDLLASRFHVSPWRNFPINGDLAPLIVNRRPIYNTAHKRTSPRPIKKKSNAETKRATHGGASETRRKDDGPVVLLRRGESLDSLVSKISVGKANPRSPNRRSLDDTAFPKHIRDVYAGSAFSLSPSPCSLPVPSFFNKKQQIDGGEIDSLDNPATRDLRRLLRLD